MRKRGVYPVIKEAHAKEAVPSVRSSLLFLSLSLLSSLSAALQDASLTQHSTLARAG